MSLRRQCYGSEFIVSGILPRLSIYKVLRITIIAPFTFGYVNALAEKLSGKEEVEVLFINTGELKFKYSSAVQRIENFYLKTFFRRNLKRESESRKILELLASHPKQDIILIIRPDKLEKSLLPKLRNRTQRFISYYFDSLKNIPEQIELISEFDEVFSYEKIDVKNHGLRFITNFIPVDNYGNRKGEGVFNISSYDDRFSTLEEIARQLDQYHYPYKFIVRKEKPVSSRNIRVIPEYLSLEEVQEYIELAEILLDIQKEDQQGLSFRVFEALGADKKLITTNKDVKNYDFYNPDNILIIDKNKPVIPPEFLIKLAVPVAEEIKYIYRRDHWIWEVFAIK